MVQPGIDASRQDTNRPFRLLGRSLGYVHFLTHPPVRICPVLGCGRNVTQTIY